MTGGVSAIPIPPDDDPVPQLVVPPEVQARQERERQKQLDQWTGNSFLKEWYTERMVRYINDWPTYGSFRGSTA